MKDSKSIALVFTGDFPEGDQKNARLKCIANSFRENGWSVEFVSMYPTSFSKSSIEKQLNQWNGIPIKHILNWSNYPKFFPARVIQLCLTNMFLSFYIFRNIFKSGLYYFYTPQFVGTLLPMLFTRLLGKKIIVDQTDLHSTTGLKYLHVIEEYLVGKVSNYLLVISPFLFEHFKTIKKRNIHLIPIMVDIHRFESNIEPQNKLLGYIGSFSAKDGISDMLKGFKVCLNDDPKLRLRLIGRDPYNFDTTKLINQLGIEESVELTGRVTYDSIPKRLLECDTLIMNRDLSSFAETGYPIKLGEYFATKRPVLMSEGKGYQRIFNDKKEVIKYNSGDTSSFSKAVKFRYENIDATLRISYEGYKYAMEHFDSSKVAQKIVNIADNIWEQ